MHGQALIIMCTYFVPLLLLQWFMASLAMTVTNVATDQSALLEFKAHMTLDPHNVLNSICSWIGVSCSARHGRVTALNLPNMGLEGSIPPHLGNPSFIVSLNVSVNNFHGHLPEEMGQLRRLKIIDFSYNNLSGRFPSWFATLSKLQYLNLRYNFFQGNIPNEIGKLPNLKILCVGNNQLSGSIPTVIYNISSLQMIDFKVNSLSGSLPDDMCNSLPELEFLELSSNKFFGQLPSSLGKCSKLQNLSLWDNKFTGQIPQTIGNLTKLKFLFLGLNNLRGSIPSTIFNISSLKVIYLANTSLIGSLPMDLCQHLQALEYLGIYLTKLRGIIPKDMRNCTSLRYLYLSGNYLTGEKLHTSLSFDVECEIMRNIRHRNLVRIISSCCNIDFKALVLEFVPNGSLEKWLYSHNYFLDIIQRMNIVVDVASALEYLHHGCQMPMVHCDLKPSNVLLDEDMVAHVGDFGITKFLGNGDSMTRTMTLATIGYMAPEYGLKGMISVRGDVYSYGILLMETFTRKKPTDEMFTEDMNLKYWVNGSLPHAIIEVVDANLLGREEEHFTAKQTCISSVLGLALECSADLPKDRMNMKDVLATLKKIKTKFLKDVECVRRRN